MYNWYKNNRSKMAEILFWISILSAVLIDFKFLSNFNWMYFILALGAFALSWYWHLVSVGAL